MYVVRKRAESEIAASRSARQELLLHSVAVVAHHHLQRPAAGESDLRVLQGAERSGCDERAVPGAPALLHQYVSVLAARASLSLSVPQRRNQYRPRQHQLDERAREGALFRTVRRRSQEDSSGDHARRQRFGFARQRRGIADAGRPQPAARDGDADSRSLGCRQHHARGKEGVLRISRFVDGAVGRPGGDCFHRWPVHRRDARSQRAASGALSGNARRPGDPGIGSRAYFR